MRFFKWSRRSFFAWFPFMKPKTAEGLRKYLVRKVPAFKDPTLLGSGTAFHYTPHRALIEASRHFLGRTVSPNLDATQQGPESEPATDCNGVVFGYPSLTAAVQEGWPQDIYLIGFHAAVRAIQTKDHGQLARQFPVLDPNLLILAPNITRFEWLGSTTSFSAALTIQRTTSILRVKTAIVVQSADDEALALDEAFKLQAYVTKSSEGNVGLEVTVRVAGEIEEDVSGHQFAVREDAETTTLLLTRRQLRNEDAEIAGWGDGSCRRAVVSIEHLRAYEAAHGPDRSADTTVHEWLHSVHGLEICGQPIPNPDHDRSYHYPGAYGNASRQQGEVEGWRKWYEAILTGKQRPIS